MNHKKISAIILAFVIASTTFPKTNVFAAGTISQSDALLQIKYNNAEKLSFTDLSNTGVEDTTAVQPSGTDLNPLFYIADGSQYVNVTKLSDNDIIPSINIDPSMLSGSSNEYLFYKIETTDNSNNVVTKTYKYKNITAGTFRFPSVNAANMKSIKTTFNIEDGQGNVSKKGEKTITADTAIPTLAVTNLKYSLNNETAALEVFLQATDNNGADNMLKKPAVYLNNAPVTPDNVTYNNTTGIFDIKITNSSLLDSNCSVQIFAADDGLNVQKVSFDNSYLIKFDNVDNKNAIIGDKDNTVTGSLPSGGTFSSLKIDNTAASIKAGTPNTFTAPAQQQSSITANYTYNSVPITYTANYASDTTGPNFNQVECNGITTSNNGTVYLKDNNLTLSGNITDNYFSSDIAIDSINYQLDGGQLNTVSDPNSGFNSSNGSFSYNLTLDNNNDINKSLVTINTHDKFNNQTSYSFNVVVDKTSPVVDCGTLSGSKISEGEYFSSAIQPTFKIDDNNIDTSNSTITIKKYDDFGSPQTVDSFNANDSTKLDRTDDKFTLKNALNTDAEYEVIVHAVDLSGNFYDFTRNFYVVQAAPAATISDSTGYLKSNNSIYAQSVTPVITVSHKFLSLDDIKNDYTHHYVNIKLDGTSLSTANVIQDTDTKDYIITCAPITDQKKSASPYYNLTVTTTSKSGVTSAPVSKDIYIDTTAPTITYIDENNNEAHADLKNGTKYFNNDVKPKITVSDDIKINQSGIKISKNDIPIDSSSITSPDGGKTWEYGDLLNSDGYYTISVDATDAAGNTKAYNYSFTIDKTKPTLSNTNIKNIAEGNATQYYYRNDFNPTVTINETNLDETASYFNVSYNNGTPTKVYFSELNGQNGIYNLNNGSNKYLVDAEGQYNVTIHVQDKAGNRLGNSDLASTFFIEKPAKITFTNVSNNDFVNFFTPCINIHDAFIDQTDFEAGKITAVLKTIDSAGNEISSTPYDLNCGLLDKANNNLTITGRNSITESKPGEKYILTVSVEDRAYNNLSETPICSSVTFTIDNTKPILNSIKNNNADLINNHYYNTAINPTIYLTEANLDRSSSYFDVTYYPNDGKSNVPGTETKYYLDGTNNVTSANNSSYTLNNILNNDGKYTVSIHLEDTAHNSTDSSAADYFIDKTAVSLNSTNIDNRGTSKVGYYNHAVTPEFQITDMFLDGTGDDLTQFITATLTDEAGNTKPYKLKVVKRVPSDSNPNLYTLYLEGITPITPENGSKVEDFSLNLKAYHRSSDLNQTPDINETRSFTIDETTPQVSNSNIVAGKYYRAAIDPSIKVSGKYIDRSSSNFSVSKDGILLCTKDFTSPDVIDQGNGNFTLANTIKDDGKYDVTVHIANMAGNCSNDLSEEFFVDSSPASPTITNIQNGGNYNSTVTPIITINDKFLTADDIANGEANDANSGKLIYATLNGNPYKLTFISNENGVLTLQGGDVSSDTPRGTTNVLQVYTKDRAAKDNNEDWRTDQKSFVVDKTAPTISFNDANNRDIENNQYYQGVINPVIHFSDNYAINTTSVTINGNPYNGSLISTGDGYTFTGAPITADGVYTLTANATDEATNSAVTFQITFTLDNTKPNISINGIQDNEFNNKSCTPISIKVSDINNNLPNTVIRLTKNGLDVPVNAELSDDRFNLNVFDEGLYKLTVTATDKAGNSYTAPALTFTINRTKPVMVFNVHNGDYINKAFIPTITTIDPLDTATVFDLTIDGQAVDPNNIPLLSQNKQYELKAKAKDKAGNISDEVTIDFVIDTISPEIDISDLISNFFYNKTIAPFITAKDINMDSFIMLLNNSPYDNGIISAEGTYELKLIATDKAKNVTEQIIDFVIDKTKPLIYIQGVINGKIYNSIIKPLISINKSSDIILLLDGEEYHGEPIDKDGKHTLIIKAVDKAGNLAETELTFLLKMTPPTIKISGVENGKTYYHSVTPTIILSDDALADSTVITLDNKAYSSGTNVSSPGAHTLTIETKDNAGNTAKKTINFNISLASSSPTSFISQNKNILVASAVFVIAASLSLYKILNFMKRKKLLKSSSEEDTK